MAIEFYDVKLKKKVEIAESNVKKVTFTTKGDQIRYGLRATTEDNRKLTKFVSKDSWDKLNVPEEK
jgi:hypothetical protein